MAVLRKTAFTLITLLALLIAVLLVCTLFAIPINLTPLHGVIERQVSRVFARPVTIAGIELLPGRQSELTLTDIHIGNPHGWQEAEDFARIARAQVQFDPLSLLRGEPTLQRVLGENIELALINNADGQTNWEFKPLSDTAAPAGAMPLNWPDELTLRQITVRYRTAGDVVPFPDLQFEEINARAAADATLQLEMTGNCPQPPCQLQARLAHSGSRFRLSQIRGQLGASDLNGQADLDLSNNSLALSAQLDVTALDARLLQTWWHDADLSGPIEQIMFTAKSQGTDVKTLLNGLQIALRADNARLQLRRTDKTVHAIDLSRSELVLQPGQPLQISVGGTLDQLPLQLTVKADTGQLAPPAGPPRSALPVQLSGSVAGNNVRADGRMVRDSGQLTLDLKIDADGPQLDKLAALFGKTGAPALPYRLHTRLRYTGTDVQLSDLAGEIGSNAWHGTLGVSDIHGSAPRLSASLHAAVVNLAVSPAPAAVITQHKEPVQQIQETEAALNLDKNQIRQVQTALTRLGFDTRGVDGMFGRHTRSAIQSFQNSRRQAPTGYLNADQLAVLLDNRPPPPATVTTARSRHLRTTQPATTGGPETDRWQD